LNEPTELFVEKEIVRNAVSQPKPGDIYNHQFPPSDR